VLLALNLPFAPLWAKLLKIPAPYLYAGIGTLAALGVYSISTSVLDLVLLLGLGLLGLLMRRFDMPLAPVLIGVILGPLAETELRRSISVAAGDLSFFVSSPLTISLYSVLIVGGTVIAALAVRGRLRAKRATAAEDKEREATPAGRG
jgi:putative tricarboxylic transport membrane protein